MATKLLYFSIDKAIGVRYDWSYFSHLWVIKEDKNEIA